MQTSKCRANVMIEMAFVFLAIVSLTFFFFWGDGQRTGMFPALKGQADLCERFDRERAHYIAEDGGHFAAPPKACRPLRILGR